MVQPLPEGIQQALEPICDDLRRMVDGYVYGQRIGVHVVEAPKLALAMRQAGCVGQAEHLEAAAKHMQVAVDLFPAPSRELTRAQLLRFDDAVYQAYDRACWALTLEAFEDAA